MQLGQKAFMVTFLLLFLASIIGPSFSAAVFTGASAGYGYNGYGYNGYGYNGYGYNNNPGGGGGGGGGTGTVPAQSTEEDTPLLIPETPPIEEPEQTPVKTPSTVKDTPTSSPVKETKAPKTEEGMESITGFSIYDTVFKGSVIITAIAAISILGIGFIMYKIIT